MRIVFWQNIVSPHQAPVMRALAEAGHDLTVVSAEAMSDERREMRWDVLPLGPARVVLCPSDSDVRDLVAASSEDAIHVLAGARAVRLGQIAEGACRLSGRRMGLVSEAPDTRGVGGFFRWAKYSWERWDPSRGRFDFVFAMGQKGVDWFRRCGYPPDRVFPFAYVTERPVSLLGHGDRRGCQPRFVFVGRLVDLKGVDVLIEAFSGLSGAHLTIVGDGPERQRLEAIAEKLGAAGRIAWHGYAKRSKVEEFMLTADVLVLPSRKDGWGCVVNEALALGTPVICSSACGAAELVGAPWRGTVYDWRDPGALANAMRAWIAKGNAGRSDRARIRDWAICIEARSVAEYFQGTLSHVYARTGKPTPPWREERSLTRRDSPAGI